MSDPSAKGTRLREFRTSIPILTSAARENADDAETVASAKQARLQRIVEAYFNVAPGSGQGSQ